MIANFFKNKLQELFFDYDNVEMTKVNESTKIRVKNENQDNSFNENRNVKTLNDTMELPKKTLSTKFETQFKINDKGSGKEIKFRNSVSGKFLTKNRDKHVIFSESEWKDLIELNTLKYTNYEKLIFSLKVGINDNLRGKIWMLLSNSLSVAMSHSENLYYKLLKTTDETLDNVIIKDINRTLMYTCNTENNSMEFLDISYKHTKLFNILKAYAVYDPDVYYCQGTNYIVAVLLNSINSERACFWTFVQIMNDKKWRDLFINNTPKLMRMLEILKNVIKSKIEDLSNYFEELCFTEMFSGVFTQYFITLFSYNTPIEYTNRVMDLFWLYEEKVILDSLIHILTLQKEVLMKMEMDELFHYIRDKIIIDTINTYGLQKSLPY